MKHDLSKAKSVLLAGLDYDQNSSSDFEADQKIPTQGFSDNFEAFLITPSLHVCRFSVRTRMLIMCPTQLNSF